MAQRTGADGFLALRAKAAGALALAAAAVLAVSGCGGGGDSDSETQTASTPGPVAKSDPGDTANPQSSAAQGQGTSAGAAQGQAPQGSAGSQGNAKGKQGPPIVLPEGSPEPAPTPAERAQATVASIIMSSPALPVTEDGATALPAAYTCDGKDSWPALSWLGVPPGTKELVLFAMTMEPVNEALFFDWALAGLDPGLEGIEAGKLPAGAIAGKNSFGQNGYSICPPKGKPETFLFSLYALPEQLAPKRGFDPATLREEILDLSGSVGLLAATYGR